MRLHISRGLTSRDSPKIRLVSRLLLKPMNHETSIDSGSEDKRLDANEAEVARYNALAELWWNENGPMWPLHKLNHLRVPFVQSAIRNTFDFGQHPDEGLAGLTVLDIGCGAGLLSEAMAKKGALVTGVDAAEKNINIATEHANAGGLDIEYHHGTVDKVRGRRFDVVLNMEVVEHVVDVAAFISSCCDCVKPGGIHIVATLNRNPKSWLFAIVGAEYVLRWLPRGTHNWQQFVKPNELEALLEGENMEIAQSAGVTVNPLTRRYSLTSDLSVNYMLVAKKGDVS